MPDDGGAPGRLEAKRHALAARVAAGAAHDLNNLLGRIIGLAEMAMDEVADRPGACAELETLISTAERAAGEVRRLDSCAGPAISEPRCFDLGATMDAACRAAPGNRPSLRRAETTGRAPWPVFADEDLVRLALDALLRDADRRAATRVDVLYRLLPSGREAEIVFLDDGAGAAPDSLAAAAASEAGGRLEASSGSGTTTRRLILPAAGPPVPRGGD